MLNLGVGSSIGGEEEEEAEVVLEELKIVEIERSDKLCKDITSVFVEFITYDAEPYERH